MDNLNEENNEKRVSRLSPELLEKARVELNEIQSEVPGHIDALRERILQDPTLGKNNFRTDDSFLLRFLRARMFDQDKAFQLMMDYHKQRGNYPQLYGKTKAELEKTLESTMMGVLPKRDSAGRAVILSLFERWNPNDVAFEDFVFQALLILENLIEDEAIQINGVLWIFDLTDLSSSHVAQMASRMMRETVMVLFNYFPAQMMGIHFLNKTSLFEGVYVLIKMHLSKNLRNRVTVHGSSMVTLHKFLSPEILPEELGGQMDTVDNSEWNKILLQNYERITEDFKYGLDKPQ